MYRYVVLVSLLLIAVGCQSAGSVRPQADSQAAAPTTTPAPLTGESATLVVNGMACPMCKSNIDKQLLKVPGVSHVKVDLGTGKVAVSFKSDMHPTRQQLAAAVEQSGFTLRDIGQP